MPHPTRKGRLGPNQGDLSTIRLYLPRSRSQQSSFLVLYPVLIAVLPSLRSGTERGVKPRR